jgi:imidazolonepropionase
MLDRSLTSVLHPFFALMERLLITHAKALVGTFAADVHLVAGAAMQELPMIEDGWLLVENGRIVGLGQMSTVPQVSGDTQEIDATGRYVLSGWCDPHTHTVFAAPREEEFVDKIKGLSYQDIAAKGGGILNSARKLRVMDEDALFEQAKLRLEEMMRQGTTAVEIKSGYGLSLESELKMLRVVKRLKETLPLQIKATLLAAHALPTEFLNDRAGYLTLICETLIPKVAAEGLADFVDVFCETNYFTVAEMEQVLEAGTRHGLLGKVHVNQFTSIGGIQAAVKHGALSVDHLEVMEAADIEAMVIGFSDAQRKSTQWVDGTGADLGGRSYCPIPTLLPSCSFFLRIPYAPARQLIDQGLPMALATDHNPGSTPSGNMNLVLSLACIQLRMLPEEAIVAMTLNAAAAMGSSHEVGSLTVGKRASVIITKQVPSLAFLPYAFGSDHIDTVLIDGRPVRSGTAIAPSH